MRRGKRTPRKNLKRGVSKGNAFSEMERSKDPTDTSMPEAEPPAEAKPTTLDNLDAEKGLTAFFFV